MQIYQVILYEKISVLYNNLFFGFRVKKVRFAFIKKDTLKIEQVLIHYLLKYKYLSLQGIGTFILEGTVADSADPNRPIIIPEGAITFTHDTKVVEDPVLVEFIIEQTGKIPPLASADLDSYLMLGRQFLNIGNPFIIPSIGTIDKTNSGDLFFKGGTHMAERMEANKAKIEDEGAEEYEENLFNDYQRETKGKAGKTVLIAIGVVIIGLIAWAVWKYAFNAETEPANVTQATFPTETARPEAIPEGDSAGTPDALSNEVVKRPASSDGSTFKLVVNQYTNLPAAQTRYKNLRSFGRNVVLYTKDSMTYKIALPFTRPLSDTTKVLDSVQRDGYYTANRGIIDF